MKRKETKTGVAFAFAACLGLAIGCGETGKARVDATVFIAEKTAAAEKGDAKAALALGVFCEGRAGDMPKALEWYRKAAELGDSFAAMWLALLYENGEKVERNSEEAFRWALRAAELGDRRGAAWVGKAYLNGSGVEENETEGRRWLRRADELGDGDAAYLLGICYWNGDGVAKDEAEANRLFRKAVERTGDGALSKLGLARCYANGWGVEKDQAKAVELYREAANAGDEIAAVEFDYCCEIGAYVPKDVEKAREYYRKGATSESETVRTAAQQGLERLARFKSSVKGI